jgi:hypothetical protein
MREGNHAVMTGWGFLAVRLPMPEDKKWAEARTTILKALGLLDPEGKSTPRLEAIKAVDMFRLTQEAWQKERDKMVKACSTCHSISFAREEIEKGDRMIREADLVMAEAILTVANLYKEGFAAARELPLPGPDVLSFHDSPRRSSRSSRHVHGAEDATFQELFMPTWTTRLWYGWSAMKTSL